MHFQNFLILLYNCNLITFKMFLKLIENLLKLLKKILRISKMVRNSYNKKLEK